MRGGFRCHHDNAGHGRGARRRSRSLQKRSDIAAKVYAVEVKRLSCAGDRDTVLEPGIMQGLTHGGAAKDNRFYQQELCVGLERDRKPSV